MNRKTIEFLFSIIRSAVCNKPFEKNIEYSKELISACLTIAKKHDIIHLAVYGLQINDILSDDNKLITNELLKAIYRYEQQYYDLEFLCDILEKNKFRIYR